MTPAKRFVLSRRRLFIGVVTTMVAMYAPEVLARIHGGISTGGGGGAVTLDTMTLKTKAGGNIAAGQPFEFGLPIAPATVAQTDKIQLTDASSNILTVQEDNRIVDANGDVRFVKVTTGPGLAAPGAASTTITIQKLNGTPNTSNPITIANLLAQTISADTFEGLLTLTMPNGDVYTAKASDGLNASTSWTYGSPFFEGYFRQGPLCTEFVVLMPFMNSGTPHPYLYAEMHVMAYKQSASAWNNVTNPITGVKVYFFVENGFNGTTSGWAGTPQDYTYDLTFSTGAGSPVTQLSLTGAAGSGNITLGATTGFSSAVRASGTWVISTTTPNSNDCGKALIELSGSATGVGYLSQRNSTTNMSINIPTTTPFASTTVTSWKTMGVYHYWGSRVSNTNPAIGGNWWGTNSDLVYPILKTSYLLASQMVPNFLLTSASAAAPDLTNCNRDGAHPCGMSMASGNMKNYGDAEASTGDVNHIGVFTYEQATAAIWWDNSTQHANARTLVIYNAEVGHKKPYWFRNEEYGTLNSTADGGNYKTTQGGATQIAINAFYGGTQWFQFASNHSGQTNYFPYLVTGDLYHLQNMLPLATQYGMFCSDYGIYDTASTAITISSSILTGPGTMPTQTGEPVQVKNTGNILPHVGGIAIAAANRYYYRAATSNTGSLYDTLAHALAGGATGLVTFSSSTAGTYLNNGFTKSGFTSSSNDGQTRQIAWNARSIGQYLALLPSNPITATLICPDATKTLTSRLFTGFGTYMNTHYTSNVNYQAGGPRAFYNHQGTNSGQWQINYTRQSLLHLTEIGVQATGGNIPNLLDWSVADVNQWHINTSVSFPPAMCSSYYFMVETTNVSATNPTVFDYATWYTRACGTPFGGVAYGAFVPQNITATVGTVAVPSAVTITLSAAYFDTSNKTPYEGNAWIAILTVADRLDSVKVGIGQITTIVSSTVCIIDTTVTTWRGLPTKGPSDTYLPVPGAGQFVALPIPSPGNAATVVTGSANLNYINNNPVGMISMSDAYGVMDWTSLQIAHQRGIDASNFTAAKAEMTNRNYPTSWAANTVGVAVKLNLASR